MRYLEEITGEIAAGVILLFLLIRAIILVIHIRREIKQNETSTSGEPPDDE